MKLKQIIKTFLTKKFTWKTPLGDTTITISDGAGRSIDIKVAEGELTEEITEVVDLGESTE